MSVHAEIRAAGVDDTNVSASLLYLGRLSIPRDRREGLLRLYMAEANQVPSLGQIEQVRSSPSP